MTTSQRIIIIFLTTIFLSGISGRANGPIHVLCLAARDTQIQGLDTIDPQAIAAYRKAGYIMHLEFYEDTAPEDLHRYPVVIGMIAQLHQGTRAISDELAAGIDTYVNAGGGFILIPGPSYYGVADFTKQLNPLLKPYGAELLKEIPLDTARQIENVQTLVYRYLQTTNILEHPVTAGINELLLPLDFANNFIRTHTMRVSSSWDILLRGEKTTASYPFNHTAHGASPGTWTKEPPILAVRSWGDGKFALFTTASRYYIWDAYHRAHGSGLVMKNGGLRLMCNLLDFVSASGYARDKPPVPVTADAVVHGNVPIAVDKTGWLQTVLSTRRPPGYRVHAYIDCGAVADRPWRPESGYGHLDCPPSSVVRWPDALRFHVTGANARLVKDSPLRYRFNGLTPGKKYRLAFMIWNYRDDTGCAVRVAFDDYKVNREWVPSRFLQHQGPRLEHIEIPAAPIEDGSLEVSFSLGDGGKGTGVAICELWLFAQNNDDTESAESILARCEPPENTTDLLPRPTPIFRGLIGARSIHGGGETSVADMTKATRLAGLDFLVFTDPVSNLTTKAYNALLKDCIAASSANFTALPGVRFKDSYPDLPKTPDKQRGIGEINAYSFQAIERIPELSDFGKPYSLLWKFFGGAFSGGKNAAPTLLHPGLNTISPFYQRFWRGFNLYTFNRKNDPIDNSRTLFRDLLASGYSPQPRVSGDYHTPADIKAAAQGWHTLIPANRLNRIGLFHYASMVSNGPRFEHYAFTSDHTTNGENGGGVLFRDHARVFFHCKVSHDLPISTVTLYRNDTILRQWHPHSRQFNIVEPLLISSQSDLMTHIQSADGSEAFSGRFQLVDNTFYCGMCADNQNTISSLTRIPSEFIYDEREIYLQHSNWHTGEAMGSLALPKDTRELVPRIIETGIIQSCKYFKPCPRIRFRDGRSEDHIDSELRIQSASGDHYVITYDFNTPGNNFRSHIDLTVYRPSINGAAAILVESELTANHDIPTNSIDSIRMLSLAMMSTLPPAWRYTWVDTASNLLTTAFSDIPAGKKRRHLPAPGSPIMIWPSDAGNLVIIPLDCTPNKTVFGNLQNVWNGREYVEFEAPGRAFAAGEVLRSSFLVMLWPGSITSPEQLLSLASRYTDNIDITSIENETVAEADYRIRLNGKYGSAGTFVISDPRRDPIPLEVQGVNPGWSCGVELDGILQLAPSGNTPMRTVIDPPIGSFRIAGGNMLTADNPSLIIDWGGCVSNDLYFYAHNPLDTKLTTTVRTNPVFHSLPGIDLRISLAPGQGQWFRTTPSSFPK